MPPLSFRMLILFLVAAVFLNFSNYTFIQLYDPPVPLNRGNHHNQEKKTQGEKPSPFIIDPKIFELLCGVNLSMNDPICLKSSSPKVVTYDLYDPDKAITTPCPELPPGLGPYLEDSSNSLENYAFIYNELRPGGKYNTTSCVSRYNVAVIVPFMGDKNKLASSFLYVLHLFLMKQMINYQIFVIGQSNTTQRFNRGKLLNVGFTEARRVRRHWDCYVFHEANIVPLDTRNLYRCSWYPRQLAASIDRPYKYVYVLDKKKVLPPIQPTFGGAIAMTDEQFLKVNGFSNSFWSNDAEYDDLYNRLNISGYLIERSLPTVGKYRTLRDINLPISIKSKISGTVSPLYLFDGLASLTYVLTKVELRPMYTHIQVNVGDIDHSATPTDTWAEMLSKPAHATVEQTDTENRNENVTADINETARRK